MTEVEVKPAHGESDDSDAQAKLYHSQKDRLFGRETQGAYDLNDELRYRNALKTMLPCLPDHMAKTTSALGDECCEYGLGEKNRRTVETLIRYSFEQGLAKVRTTHQRELTARHRVRPSATEPERFEGSRS
ncbi:MAG TPA: hypothetical protein VE198_05815 [Actinoallomurus sp.]|nr:hypothetical protein [Actinoallomurus sp.]